MTWKNKKDREQDTDLRRQVLSRDGYTCQMCMKKKTGRYLQVHHIQRWADAIYLRFDPTNLITLCKSCHYSIRNQETHYMMYFLQRVQANLQKKRKK